MPNIDPLTLHQLLHFKWTKGKAIESKCVADVEYDPTDRSMIIVFQERGTYKYHDVPIDVYVDFETSGSRGTYFNSYIRDRFNYERVG
jgi:lysyl-tRNA synthetase class 2